MRHPYTRAERRHARESVISYRKFIHDHIWYQTQIHTDPTVLGHGYEPFSEFGRYAKYNLNCGCMQCHSAKYLSAKDKRRRSLKEAESQAEFRKKDKVAGKN